MTKEVDDLKKKKNWIQREKIVPKKKANEDCTEEITEMKATVVEIKEKEALLPSIEEERDRLLNRIGHIVDPEVPISEDEDKDNLVVSLYPIPPEEGILPAPQGSLRYTLPATNPLTHDDLLRRIGGYESERGRKVAGHRTYFLTNAGVLLNQAIINYAISFLAARVYDVLQPPFFMKKDVMAKIAQLEDYD